MTKRIYLLFFLGLVVWGCKTNQLKPSPEILLSEKQQLIFLDSVAAGKVIIVDEKEQFFDRVNILDMSIQMGKSYEADVKREVVLKDYQAFLKSDVSDFSEQERTLLHKVYTEAHSLCEKLNSNIFPPRLQLIKSKGRPYGGTTYYTRDNSIVLPIESLEEGNYKSLLEVALHEIFHIYSRYNPEKQKELYALIGFHAIPQEHLILPSALKARVLLNPDGVNFAQAIKMANAEGKKIQAIPLIVANETSFKSGQEDFFSYLQFDLYQIKLPLVKNINVLADNEGKSTIQFQKLPDFFKQIKDNTGYIIHPDEVLADNFMLIATESTTNTRGADLSEAGKQLLTEVEQILRKP